VLLRNIETGMYYEDASKWTSDQAAAFDFKRTTRVVELVFSARLENVEMLLTSEHPQFDLIVPIDQKSASALATSAAGNIRRASDSSDETASKPQFTPPL